MNVESQDFLYAIVWSNLRVVILITAAFLLMSVLRVREGTSRHAVWMTTILACLCLPLLSAWLPTIALPVLPFGPYGLTAGPGLGGEIAMDAAAAALTPSFDWAAIGLGVYLVGVAAFTLPFGCSLWQLRRHQREYRPWQEETAIAIRDELRRELGIIRSVALFTSDQVDSPLTWGALRPRVVLPDSAVNWPAEQLRNVLAHELCHVSRFDWLRLAVQRLTASIYWFNPFVWYAVRQCAFEAERACDDFVLRSGGRSSEYADQLVNLMASRRRPVAAGVALGHGHFARRIRAIVNSSVEAHPMNTYRTRSLSAVTASFAVALAACQVTSGQPVQDGQVAATAEQEASMPGEEAERRAVQQQTERERQAAEQLARSRALESAARTEEAARAEAELLRERESRAREVRRADAAESAGEQARRVEEARNRVVQREQIAVQADYALRESREQLLQQQVQMESLRQTVEQRDIELEILRQSLAQLQEQVAELAQLQEQVAELNAP